MAKKAIRVKTNTKVVRAQKGNAPAKPQLRSKAPGLFTEKIVIAVNSNKN